MAGLRMIFITCLLILLPFFMLFSQNAEKLKLKKGSKIWLEGKTNLSSYLCSIDSFKLEAKGVFRHKSGSHDSLVVQPDHLSLTLFVSSIHCGNKLMNHDVHEALNYPENKKIIYTYRGLESSPDIKDIYTWNTLNIKGTLEIKNVSNKAVFPVKAKHLEKHQFHITGNHTIDMLQYNVEPPSRLNGLIQARKKLTVHFNIIIGSES